jgi:hypothetical protein
MVNLNNKIIVEDYDCKKYDFYKCFHDLLKVYTDKLDLLHAHLPKALCPKNIVTVANDQNLSIYKILYKIDDGYDLKNKKKNSGFLNVFDNFVLSLSKNIFKEDLVYQSRPTLRVNFPNNKAVGDWHRDREYNHPLEEINIWVPITKSINTNTIWIESQFDKNDYGPVNTNYGQFIMFDSGLKHGNKLNTENKTRISFDFRVIPKSLYNKHTNKTSIDTKMKFEIGDYYKSTESNILNYKT